MTWSDAFTRELRLLDFAIGILVVIVIFAAGFITAESIYGTLLYQQGAALDAAAARHCIWLDPPRDR